MSFVREERITSRQSRQELANAELDWVKFAQEKLKQHEQQSWIGLSLHKKS